MGSQSSTQKNYSFIVPGSEDVAKGQGAIHRHPARPDGTVSHLEDGCKTMWDTFSKGVEIAGDNDGLGFRPIDANGKAGDFQWISYNKCMEKAKNFGSGLVVLKLMAKTSEGDMNVLALYCKVRERARRVCLLFLSFFLSSLSLSLSLFTLVLTFSLFCFVSFR
jgi:hypothetical protein